MKLDLVPLLLSLKVALISTLVVFLLGSGLGWLINYRTVRGREILDTIIGLPLVLPPTVIGFVLLLLLGRNGPLGRLLEGIGIRVVFTWWAGVIAAAVVSLPLMYRSALAAFETVDHNLEQAARTLGSSEWRVFFTITLPLAWPGLAAGIMLSFARALGEFGATLMLAGNIPGRTQTIPLAIFFAAESGDMGKAAWLVFLISLIAFGLTYGLNIWSRGKFSRSMAGIHRGDNCVGSYHYKNTA